MITILSKPHFITTSVENNKITITTDQLNKKIRITARYKCCYCDSTEILFKQNEPDNEII